MEKDITLVGVLREQNQISGHEEVENGDPQRFGCSLDFYFQAVSKRERVRGTNGFGGVDFLFLGKVEVQVRNSAAQVRAPVLPKTLSYKKKISNYKII
jgi:hypothetical protein